jgi:hypothetical protein
MSENKRQAYKDKFKNTPLLEKILGVLFIILAFAVFFLDRIVSALFFYKDYPNFVNWINKTGNIAQSLVRVALFLIPILIYKILF